MSSIFEVKSSDRALSRPQNRNVKVVRVNQVKFDEKSPGREIWNRLPSHIKNVEKVSSFKQLIKTWDGVRVSAIYVKKSE